MRAYLVGRLAGVVPVALLISLIAFGLLYVLPGDPALAMLGDQLAADKQLYAQLRQELGLDAPLPVQYLRWLGRLAHGDLGTSVRTREPVLESLLGRLPVTIELGLLSLALAVALGLGTALACALHPGGRLDLAASFLAMGGVAIPHFWLGVLLIYLLAVWLQLLPPTGYSPPSEGLGANLATMVMPVLTVGTGLAAVISRQARAALVEVLQQDYVRTARAKGLRGWQVIGDHALKNALIPVATIVGLQLGNLFAGAAVTETIFALPGVGRLVVDAIFLRDYPVAQGAALLMAIAVLAANLATDVVYAYLDPRIRYG